MPATAPATEDGATRDGATEDGAPEDGAGEGRTLPTSFAYKPALDGLRAVAVGSVIAFHFGADGLDGGFLGVDTFFVISGYLITSLLLTEWGRTDALDFVAFWARRAKRLLPALFLVLIAVGIWANLEANPIRLDSIRADMLWTLFYGANWHFIRSGQSYFDLFSEASPLRHAWSLAIEEQFYLVWPLITFAAMRLGRGRPRVLAALCIVGILASSAVMLVVYEGSDPSRAYYGTDARASQLLVGALLAILLTRWTPSTSGQQRGVRVLGLVGAAFSLWAFTGVTDRDAWLYHGGFLLFAVATALVILAVVQPSASLLGHALSVRPVRWVGMISYGLYLWHWPIVVALSEPRTGLSGWELAALRLVATFGIATVSYYVVERPIRHGALKGWVARVAAPAAFVVVAITTIALTAGAKPPPDFLTAAPSSVLQHKAPTVASTAPGTPTPPAALGRVLLVGDSVAESLGDALQLLAAQRGTALSTATRPGCGMVTGTPTLPDGSPVPWGRACSDSTLAYLDEAVAQNAPNTVLWLSTWETADRIVGDRLYRFGDHETDAVLLRKLEESRQHLVQQGARLIILTNTPRAERSETYVRNPADDAKIERLNAIYRKFAARNPESVTVVDLAAIVCPDGPPCPEVVDGVQLRPRDGGHFEGDGPGWVAPRLLDAISRAAWESPASVTTSSSPGG
jgi:peptidoglycan/LPS O-acetylase OafA/YrhL